MAGDSITLSQEPSYERTLTRPTAERSFLNFRVGVDKPADTERDYSRSCRLGKPGSKLGAL